MKIEVNKGSKWRYAVPILNFQHVIADKGKFHPWPLVPWWGWVQVLFEKNGKLVFDHTGIKTEIRCGIVLWIPLSWQMRLRAKLKKNRDRRIRHAVNYILTVTGWPLTPEQLMEGMPRLARVLRETGISSEDMGKALIKMADTSRSFQKEYVKISQGGTQCSRLLN